MFQGSLFQESLQGFSRKIEGCFKEVLIGVKGCLKEVQWVFEESVECVSRKFQISFKGVLRKFQVSSVFKEIKKKSINGVSRMF